jgi:hypothetical protein
MLSNMYMVMTMEPQLKECVVGRVALTMSEGEESFGTVQLSFSNLNGAIKACDRLAKIVPDEFLNRITDSRKVIIEEMDVFD